ncbi:MAG: protein-L-isoaspartate(D-aspartate) O-methyltransferase, partial [Methanobacteriota archaeon]
RERFVPAEAAERASEDTPLAIGEGQTISAPHMVAIMAEASMFRPGQRVLEIGGGSGYHAAVAATLVRPGGRVVSVERIGALADRARAALRDAGFPDVEVVEGDGSEGYAAGAPYDRISVACAAPKVPPPLLSQLAPEGALIVPVGHRDRQELLRVTKRGDEWRTESLGGCMFVPLVGRYGFD